MNRLTALVMVLIFAIAAPLVAGQSKRGADTGAKITRQDIIDSYLYPLTVAENMALMQTKTRLEAAKIVQSLYYDRLNASLRQFDNRLFVSGDTDADIQRRANAHANYAMAHGTESYKAALERGKRAQQQYDDATHLVEELQESDRKLKAKKR